MSWNAAEALEFSFRRQSSDEAVEAKSESAEADTEKNNDGLVWLNTLEEAYPDARQNGRPILVRAGATWCGWCRKLDDEIVKPDVQTELDDWTRVYLDLDKSPKAARALGIGPIPALRVLTPAGRVVASQDGYLPAKELTAWLEKHYDKANVKPLPELTGREQSDDEDLARLVAALGERESILREAAVGRLVGHAGLAAAPVVSAFSKGDLATRLAALELLDTWEAPIDGLDPWQPDTITKDRLDALNRWSEQAADDVKHSPDELSPEQLTGARREIDRMLRTDDETEVDAIRERLGRLGRPLLAEVYAQLESATTDRDRQRLTALRYRLVAPDALSLSWPGGLQRLASTDPATRQQAAEELAGMAKTETEPLLLELFSNADPLVREISLKALRQAAGAGATEALAGLLDDPEPNVRAAVLKQLAEQPSKKMVDTIGAYIEREQDADLIVHAVRVLRATRGSEALGHLSGLADHATWQVRAEVAEAIGECLHGSSRVTSEARGRAIAALTKLSEDEDMFVADRAKSALRGVDVNKAAVGLVAATADDPKLAADLLEQLTRHGSAGSNLASQLRDFLKHNQPEIRAKAIELITEMAPSQAGSELEAALADESDEVRLAAARSLFEHVFEVMREGAVESVAQIDRAEEPRSQSLVSRVFDAFSSDDAKTESASPTDSASEEGDWVTRFRSGQNRSGWMDDLVSPLTTMLAENSAEHRLWAALDLIALGKDEAAVPVVLEVSRDQVELRSTAAKALVWLEAQPRLKLFRELLALGADARQAEEYINALAVRPAPEIADALWELVLDEQTLPVLLDTLPTALYRAYLGKRYSRPSRITSEQSEKAANAVRDRVAAGPDLQRALGLGLLLAADNEQAADMARSMLDDGSISDELRQAAFQVLLLALPAEEAVPMALESVADSDPERQRFGLLYLAEFGGDPGDKLASLQLGSHRIPLYFDNPSFEGTPSHLRGVPIRPEAPPGLQTDQLRGLLTRVDARTRAYVGYLLALEGDASGLKPLRDWWQENGKGQHNWNRLLYRAVSALNDDALTPVLEEVYETIDREDPAMREFYWTIRSMDGREVLKLRKRIRDEVGMDRLR